MQDILKRVQAHIPFHVLKDRLLSMVLKEGINPEISFNHATLDRYGKEEYRVVAEALAERCLTVTFHAPFLDLRPGAIDPRIRQVSIDRFNQVFDLAPIFHPRSVVCHPSFDKRYYVSGEKLWLENSIDTWQRLVARAEETDTVIALENVYEIDPEQIFLLLSAVESPRMRFCLDTGHFNVFSRTPLKEWMAKLASFICQVHIHDNGGSSDDHLPVGEGNFPFLDFFRNLAEKGIDPIITIEAHAEKDLWRAVENLRAMNLLELLSMRSITR